MLLRNFGFHRIEIIAILASMLLPALGKARSAALRAACQGDLKTISTANSMYVGDYADYLPCMGPEDYTYPMSCIWVGKLNDSYVKNSKVFTGCRRRITGEVGLAGGADPLYYYNSVAFGTNGRIVLAGGGYQKLGRLTRPSQKILYGDSMSTGQKAGKVGFLISFSHPSTVNNGAIDYRHPGNTANVICGDGHVATLSMRYNGDVSIYFASFYYGPNYDSLLLNF